MQKTTISLLASLLFFSASTAQAQIELLVNGGFENEIYAANDYSLVAANAPVTGMANVNVTGGFRNAGSTISGWGTTIFSTTVSTPIIEIWNGSFQSPSQGPGAYLGAQYAEMNSYAAGTLTQMITNSAPGQPLFLTFAHSDRGNDAAPSTMAVSLIDLGANGSFDSTVASPTNPSLILGGDDSILINESITSSLYDSATNPLSNNWTFHSFQTNTTTSNNMVLAFQSITSGSFGNFIDSVSLNTVAQSAIPEPGTLTLTAFGLLLLVSKKLKNRPTQEKA